MAVIAGPRIAQTYQASQGPASDQLETTNEYAAYVGDGHRIEISSPTKAERADVYLRYLLKELQYSWGSFIPDEARNGAASQVTAVFEIRPNGKILKGDPRIVSSSGQAKLDMAAVYAIRYWKQYEAPPAGFQGPTLKVQVRFWYNVSRTTWVDLPPALLPGRAPTNIANSPPYAFPSGIDILSDTQGLDFNPYINRMLATLKHNWLDLMPDEARAGKRGAAFVTFAILPNGYLSSEDARVERSSGNGALDGAALGAIQKSTPFEALPSAFLGPYLKLRVAFLYNMTPEDVGLSPRKE